MIEIIPDAEAFERIEIEHQNEPQQEKYRLAQQDTFRRLAQSEAGLNEQSIVFHNERMKEDLRWQLKSVEFALDCFESEQKRKGNPERGPLPAEIETLYDLQWQLASELYCLDDVRFFRGLPGNP
jgi:hypothetical protein